EGACTRGDDARIGTGEGQGSRDIKGRRAEGEPGYRRDRGRIDRPKIAAGDLAESSCPIRPRGQDERRHRNVSEAVAQRSARPAWRRDGRTDVQRPTAWLAFKPSAPASKVPKSVMVKGTVVVN